MKFESRTSGDLALATCALHRPAYGWLTKNSMFNPPIPRWNGQDGPHPYGQGANGSANFAPPAFAARLASNVITVPERHQGESLIKSFDYQFFVDLARCWKDAGFAGREFGSEVYWPCIINAWILLLRALTHGQAEKLADPSIRETLRSMWTLFAFQANPQSITTYDLQGSIENITPKPESRRYTGLALAQAGDRFNHATAGGQKLVGAMLSAALNYPENRHFKGTEPLADIPIPDGPPVDSYLTIDGDQVHRDDYVKPWHLMLSVLMATTGGPGCVLGDDLPASRFGLTEVERDTLIGVVERVPDAEEQAFEWLDMRCWGRYERIRVVRTETSVMTACKKLTNRNKFGAPAARLEGRTYSLMIPSTFEGTGATIPNITWLPDSVEATGDGRICEMDWPRGPRSLSFDIAHDGVVRL